MGKSNENEQNTERKGVRVFRIIRSIFIYILAAGIIVAALLFAASVNPSKSLFGYRYYTVLTPSMEPAYSVGDMVFVKIETADHINVGDVITFNPSSDGDAYLTHRVVDKLPDYQSTGVTCFKTKGDANDSDDTFLIDEGRVIGVVTFKIPMMGYVVRFVQMRWYFIVPIIALIFVFFKLMGIYLDPGRKKKAIAAEASQTEEASGATPSTPEAPSEESGKGEKSEAQATAGDAEQHPEPDKTDAPKQAD